ncbi:nuclear transport factor 2 family protein [Variovorax sp.]|jgi:ketosteroid isomerase-like protein|uniref:nuclear transport factor 2 family protein n=1 Tax=Variovorax sp. TaxID=1871043 RepID=UPI001224BCC7|nr:nuclear transport factor 2 family protein [Variovorax sp.]TAJ62217.1 MAG: nuclear transport factor 2 family protein [Variovorax sp.]
MTADVSIPDAARLLPELTQALHRFFHALDRRDYDAMLALFADDCRWLRQGRWLEGKPAVRAALEARAADVETRHVLTNAHVSAQDGTSAEVEAYMTAYRHPAAAQPDGAPPRIAGPLRFNLTTTVFRRDPGQGWRIAEQRMVTAFDFASASAE